MVVGGVCEEDGYDELGGLENEFLCSGGEFDECCYEVVCVGVDCWACDDCEVFD